MTEKLNWILQYFSAQPNLRFNFSEICRINHWHQPTLLKEFRDEFGVTPKQLEAFLRLKASFLLLKQEPVKCMSIAEELGFKNEIRFSEWFRNQTRVSPRHFRNLTRRQKQEFEKMIFEDFINLSHPKRLNFSLKINRKKKA